MTIEGDVGDFHVKVVHWVSPDLRRTSIYVRLPAGQWDESGFILRRAFEGAPTVPILLTGDDKFDATFALIPKSDPRILLELFTSENRLALLGLEAVVPRLGYISGVMYGETRPTTNLNVSNWVWTYPAFKRVFAKSGRLPGNEIVNLVILTVSTAKTLAMNTRDGT